MNNIFTDNSGFFKLPHDAVRNPETFVGFHCSMTRMQHTAATWIHFLFLRNAQSITSVKLFGSNQDGLFGIHLTPGLTTFDNSVRIYVPNQLVLLVRCQILEIANGLAPGFEHDLLAIGSDTNRYTC